ncbi:MAG: DNA polymerase II large subunit, partial [Nanoarchaeota archaeon]|nr:DNA polymerase II large subunit [Nanoarchaeota archaeon]
DKDIEEIIYLGDVLINYGDFFDRAHVLVPPGYCEEYWILHLKKAMEEKGLTKQDLEDEFQIPQKAINQLLKKPIITEISFELAKQLSEKLSIPLHPRYTYFYKELTREQFEHLIQYLHHGNFLLEVPKIILPHTDEFTLGKRALELLGVPHKIIEGQVVIQGDDALALSHTLNIKSALDAKDAGELLEEWDGEPLDLVNKLADFKVKDKSGIFIGSRMGRPEKAKMRKLTGSPHGLFPVGEDGGRLRSFQSALEVGKVTSTFPVFLCPKCSNKTPFSVCEMCDTRTIRTKINPKTKEEFLPDKAPQDVPLLDYKEWSVPIRALFDYCLKRMDTKIYPDLIKGVRGTVGKDHTPEHLLKAILRAKHDVAVNKDGTIRYDASEVTLTHFKPVEVGTSVAKLRSLGYTKDIDDNELEREDQVLELLAQDVVLPACEESLDSGSDKILLQTTHFIDELLVHLYKQKPYYHAKTKDDLVGHLIIGLAPHTSAGTVGRIVGFTKTQGLLAHPLYHAAMRRDCDGDESCVFLLLDAFLNFSQKYLGTSRGSTMDAPLVLTTLLNPAEVDDMAFNVDRVGEYPLEFYEACEAYKYPWEIKIEQINDVLFKPEQFEGMRYTHDTTNINQGVRVSSYKMLPSMGEKIEGQMLLGERIRAVEASDVARLVIEKHFIRDTKGNLRKFSLQQFRCVHCNEKYRRPPLSGKCTNCGGKIIFTISEGSIMKYLQMSIDLAEKFNVSNYLKETLYLTRKRVIDVFGKEKEKQTGLGDF